MPTNIEYAQHSLAINRAKFELRPFSQIWYQDNHNTMATKWFWLPFMSL